jgi:cytochrome c-type biogenesis protein CcmH
VIDWMVTRYGDFVRLTPPFVWATLLLWAAPVLALMVAAVAVVLTRRRIAAAPPPLSADEQRRLAELLKP